LDYFRSGQRRLACATRHVKHCITFTDVGVLDERLRDGAKHCANGTGVFLPVVGRLAPLAQDLICLSIAQHCLRLTFWA
jgi:hypothetical protein